MNDWISLKWLALTHPPPHTHPRLLSECSAMSVFRVTATLADGFVKSSDLVNNNTNMNMNMNIPVNGYVNYCISHLYSHSINAFSGMEHNSPPLCSPLLSSPVTSNTSNHE
jgi:hypothetical protein